MTLTRIAIEKRAVTIFLTFLLVVGGIAAFLSLGQLEDPDFTVKTAVVVTQYPGASPVEVEQEVTDRLEQALQELPALKELYSESRPGLSIIQVDIKEEYWADRLPQVWDELRNKISDARVHLPPGAGEPDVMDDFSFVYGFVLAVTGDGYSQMELDDVVEAMKKELSVVPGVARVELWGKPVRVVYVDMSESKLAALGISPATALSVLRQQNMVVDAGGLDAGPLRFRVDPTGSFSSVAEIEELVLRGSTLDVLASAALTPAGEGSLTAALEELNRAASSSADLVRLGDVATVREGTYEPRPWEMRFDGEPAMAISLANLAGGNIVDTGRALDARLAEIMTEIPIGIEVHKVAWQSDLVTEAIDAFMVNLAQAIAIVLIVIAVPMKWRMGVIIGTSLVFTILGTFLVMAIMGDDLHRMSLGALVIALGMMVDNAIVVADGIYSRMLAGRDPTEAAIETCGQNAWPLLGATFIAVMAFYPIFASEADAGEYCRALFTVVATSLLISWLLAMTLTPVQCIAMLKVDPNAGGDDLSSGVYGVFRRFLVAALRKRVLFVGAMVGLLVVSVGSFGGVKQMFFPDAARAQLMVDYWAPAGTRVQQVSEDVLPLEEKIESLDFVESVSSFIGQGPPRFYLPVDPEANNASYAQLIVNTSSFDDIDPLIAELEPWVAENVPHGLVRLRKYGVGPSDTFKFEARFTGPADADLAELRRIGDEGVRILRDSPWAIDVRTDMRQRVRKVVPEYDQQRGRWASVSRSDIAEATKRAYDGAFAGLYRQGRDLYPILLRNAEADRDQLASDFESLQVMHPLAVRTLPLATVTTNIDYAWEDPVIIRFQRRRAITVQATPNHTSFESLREAVLPELSKIELPPEYELFWAGEAQSTREAQASLVPGIVPAAAIIVTIIVMLFNAFRQPIVILATIPFVMIGITAGLLITRAPFGFVALLGAMSLAGMMIKNAIVLLDQIGIERAAGKEIFQAIVDSAVSRLRPVVLAAATTVLGVIPLLTDPFWFSMAITIMAGLAFGTILTMVLVPVFYAMLFEVESPPAGG